MAPNNAKSIYETAADFQRLRIHIIIRLRLTLSWTTDERVLSGATRWFSEDHY